MKAYDKNGNEIKQGYSVLWTEPESGLSEEFDVSKIHSEELILIVNVFCEAEVPPHELEVINKQ